jgi:galactokinase
MNADAGGGRSALARADAAFRAELTGEPALVSRSPGRLNLIGEHVDYNDGFVLPIAIDLDVVALAAPRLDEEIHVVAVDYGQSVRFGVTDKWCRTFGWQAYVRGVAQLLAKAGVRMQGASIAIAGDLPAGTGLSSSAALVVAVTNALLALSDTAMPTLQLIELARTVETDYAGVSCGIMDPFAAICGAPDCAIFLDCRSLDYQLVPIPADVRVIATDSGTRRNLHETAYNDRVRETRDAAARLGVRSLRDITPSEFEERAGSLPEPLLRRARHVVHEIARTHAAADALEHGELERVGALLGDSHNTLRTDYEVSTPELDALVEISAAVPGVYGSRLSGAGFGGCILSLVAADAVADFVEHVPAMYRDRTGHHAATYVCRASRGAGVTDYEM